MKVAIFVILVTIEAITVDSVKYNKKFLFNLFFQPKTDVKFFLYTRHNAYAGQEVFLDDISSVHRTNYNPNIPTKFLIHGWRGDQETPFNERVTSEFLIKDDVNIFRVDWSVGAQTINYMLAARRVSSVGKTLGTFINFLNTASLISLKNITIIGFSLGSHVAGFAGKNVQHGKIRSIIGLDPAGPLFNDKDSEGRLHYTDAEYVEVIHTNMGRTGISRYIGHTDLIANGGRHQPGCLTDSCSHQRAPKFYIESINVDQFWARKCESHADVNQKGCQGELILMGDSENATKNMTGIFHFVTNSNPPFAQPRPLLD